MSDFIFKQLINGQWVDSSNGNAWDLVNPATETILMQVPFGNETDALAAIDAASAAFPLWAKKTAYERADVLMKAANWINQHVNELAVITTEECGKPLREAKGEWGLGSALFEWYAEEGKRAYGRTVPAKSPGRRIMVIHHPVGVVGTITAWNYPIYNAARAWAAALAAGCTIVGRPSEYTPRSLMLMARALQEAGAPPGVVNVVNGQPHEIGQLMLQDSRLRKIHFTGSTRVGKLLLDGASQTMTKMSLELGGNAPVIVFPDADLNRVGALAVNFKYRNNGQMCIAPQRFYVHTQVIEEFTEKAIEITQKVKVGNGFDEATIVGPMINPIQRERLESIVSDSVAAGAEVLVGGSRPMELPRGYFYSPTVLANVTTDMRVHNEEIFGPVLPIIPFSDVDEALALANKTEYGLSAYVYTNDLNTSIHMYEGLEFGIVAVNDLAGSTPEAPFGGMKQSGFDRECGPEGLESYLETKAVYIGGIP